MTAAPLHLLKLCVGCESIADLEAWIAERRETALHARTPFEHVHTTRMVPRRLGAVAGQGSLYWVIKGLVACRQPILAIRPFVDGDGIGRCRLVLDPSVSPVEPRPCRPFQGWRYLESRDAPRDLSRASGLEALPETLRRDLVALGLI